MAMDMVKVDIQKLQLLNERIGQTLEALEQVRSSVQGLQHSAAPQTWNAQPFVAPPPFGPYQQQPQQQQNPFAQTFNPYVPFQAYAFHNDPRQYDPRQYNQPQYDPRQYSPQQYSPQPYGQPQYSQPQYGQPQFNQPPPYAVRVQPPTNGLSHTAWDPSWQRLAWDPTVRPFAIS
jgi:hypothetical protein